MKRTKIFAMITAMTIAMGSLTACENIGYIESMSTDEIVEDNAGVEDEAVTEETKSNKTETNKSESNKTESNKTESNKTESNKAESNKAESNKTESKKAEPNKTESNKAESNKTEPNKTESNKAESNKTESNKTESTVTPEPTHTHKWKEHTVTEQVWVPNIVVVDDYEERVVGHVDDVFICNCGYTTTNRDDIANHVKSNGIAGNKGHGNFTIQPGYDVVEVVKVGSHEEDRGHNETKTYVDYYYCDCGEKKN